MDKNNDTRKPKAALYARVSTQEQAIEGVSIDAQAAALKATAKIQGWEVFDEYIDGGYSGGTDDRPALKRLLADARQKRFDIVAVCKLDRFFRNLRLLLNHLDDLERQGIKFVSTQEGLDTSTSHGRFTVQMMGTIAEFERERIGERVKDSRHYLVSNGSWPGGQTPYGYRWHMDTKEWEVIPGEAETVKLIYTLYLERKMGLKLITKTLNSEGYYTRNHGRWYESSVHRILTHPVYKGEHPIGVKVPAIIDDVTWQAVQERMEEARSVLAKPGEWLLQGMVYCGLCGHTLRCTKVKPTHPRYYACRSRTNRIKARDAATQRCTLPYVRADWLERNLWTRVKEVLSDSDKMVECVNTALQNLQERRDNIGKEILDSDNKLGTLRKKMERLGLVFADGTISEETYRLKLKQMKKQEATLVKCRKNIDPTSLDELDNLEQRILVVKEVIKRGTFGMTPFGMFGTLDDEKMYIPLGYNALLDNDESLEIGDVKEMDYLWIPGPDIYLRTVGPPESYWEFEPSEQWDIAIKGARSLLQLFDIRVLVYPDYVEIQGTIPLQVLYKEENMGESVGSGTGRVSHSPSHAVPYISIQ